MICGVVLVDLSFSELRAAQIFKSLCSVLLLIMCLFVYVLLTIVLSVFL